MMHSARRPALILLTGLLLTITSLHAQAISAPVTLRGLAFDSLHNRPLSAATIRILGRNEIATSDKRGRFQFDSMAPGTYMVAMEHPELDSIWSPGNSCAGAILRIAARRGVGDSIICHAMARRVSISWLVVGVNAAKKLTQTRFTLETRTDSLGRYGACGVPIDVPLQISAALDTSPSDSSSLTTLELPARATRIQRRDLMLAAVRAGTAQLAGSVRGRLTAADGTPVANARVLIEGVEVARSNDAGEYAITGVATGTRTVEFIAIGNRPVSRIVDVLAGETVTVSAQMERVTTLERVDVRATVVNQIMREFEERKRMGFGFVQDSTVLLRTTTMSAAIRGFPSVVVEGPARTARLLLKTANNKPRYCDANIFIDRHRADSLDFWALNVDEIAWIELYPRRSTVPRKFMGGRECGAIVVFTKRSIAR